ncbi:MAG: hypothetical protein WBK77_06570 [Alphaproteobacteria bacterium]
MIKRCGIGFLILFMVLTCLSVPPIFAAEGGAGDVRSNGGLVAGSRILRVTSLENSGAGTLRNALAACNKCVIVFDISGAINLTNDLTIARDQITIAGETAPSPGIVLYGGTLNIRASNVVIGNIAVYPGSSPILSIAEKRDGISIYGSPGKKRRLHDIILRNVSVGWGVDENIGIQGLVDNVLIERSIIAWPLRHGGHPKGVHSMNLLLANTVGRIIIAGSLFAAAEQRSPRLTNGNRVTFINNLVAAPGAAATHLDTSEKIINPGAIDIIGNAYIPTPLSNCKRPAIAINEKFLGSTPQTLVYLEDNIVLDRLRPGCMALIPPPGETAQSMLTDFSDWSRIPASAVPDAIPARAGSHPVRRNPIDKRLLADLSSGTLAIINSEADIGGFQEIKITHALAPVPDNLERIETQADVEKIRLWLCARQREIGAGAECR